MKTFLRILFFFLIARQICYGQFEFYNKQNPQRPCFELKKDILKTNLDSLMLDSIIID